MSRRARVAAVFHAAGPAVTETLNPNSFPLTLNRMAAVFHAAEPAVRFCSHHARVLVYVSMYMIRLHAHNRWVGRPFNGRLCCLCSHSAIGHPSTTSCGTLDLLAYLL